MPTSTATSTSAPSTNTATATPTATNIPPTQTPTNTPTVTNIPPTNTPTNTPTATSSPTATPTPIAPDCTFSIPNGLVYGTGGLIQAINTANLSPSLDIICLTPNGSYTVTTLQGADNGLPEITSPIIIRGYNATLTRQSTAPQFRLLRVASTGNLTVNNLTLSGGIAPFGGAIFSSGVLILNQVRAIGNTALSDGGALYVNNGVVTLMNSTLSTNHALLGGAVYSVGTVTQVNITNTQITDNTAGNFGGGIFNFSAVLNVTSSTLARNSARQGGAVRNQILGVITLTGSHIQANQAMISGGGLLIDSPASSGANNCFTANTALNGAAVHYAAINAIVSLNFENNWWGSPTGAAPGDLLGLIDITPFRTTPAPICAA